MGMESEANNQSSPSVHTTNILHFTQTFYQSIYFGLIAAWSCQQNAYQWLKSTECISEKYVVSFI